MQKADYRTILVERLAKLSPNDKAEAPAAITRKLVDIIDWTSIATLHIYEARIEWHEIPLRPFVAAITARHPHLSITVASQKPTSPLPKSTYDVIIVPLLGFDSRLHRLGRGAGWYDRFLARQPQATAIGIAYDCQRVEHLPTEVHDAPLGMIITPTGTATTSILY